MKKAGERRKSVLKKGAFFALKLLLWLLGALLLVVIAYVIYVFASYRRVPDNEPLSVSPLSYAEAYMGETYTITTFNIGFGAYSDDYSFFMDGGEESVARSAQAVLENTAGCIETVLAQKPDFALFQEVDLNSTRSRHIDQYALLREALPGRSSDFAVNYDSPYLFWPLTQPHGKSLAGIATFSAYRITDAVRRSLPIDTGVKKLIDLDRCYSVTHVAVEGDRTLTLVNVHLTAYADDPSIVRSQIAMLSDELSRELDAGHFVICGGDFNRDLWGNSPEIFRARTETPDWSQPFPLSDMPGGFALCRPEGEPVPTCRNANEPYQAGRTFVTVLDGFFVSDNIEIIHAENIDAGFRCSDHNPVRLDFRLIG